MKHSRHRNKIEKVMHEWKSGKLRSSSGQIVRSRKQAIAIALSEAGLARRRGGRRRRRSRKSY